MLRFFAFIVTCHVMIIPNILAASEPTTMSRENECVILLHGIGDSRSSMEKVEARLLEKGYRVVNFDYPSTSESIEHIAESLFLKPCLNAGRVPLTKSTLSPTPWGASLPASICSPMLCRRKPPCHAGPPEPRK